MPSLADFEELLSIETNYMIDTIKFTEEEVIFLRQKRLAFAKIIQKERLTHEFINSLKFDHVVERSATIKLLTLYTQ